jgi:hypothetical protein
MQLCTITAAAHTALRLAPLSCNTPTHLELAEAMACVHSTASAVKHKKYITLQATAAEAGAAGSHTYSQTDVKSSAMRAGCGEGPLQLMSGQEVPAAAHCCKGLCKLQLRSYTASIAYPAVVCLFAGLQEACRSLPTAAAAAALRT